MNHESVEHNDYKANVTRYCRNGTRSTAEQMYYPYCYHPCRRWASHDEMSTVLSKNTTNNYSSYPSLILLLLVGCVCIGSSPYFGNSIGLRMQTYRGNDDKHSDSNNAPVSYSTLNIK